MAGRDTNNPLIISSFLSKLVNASEPSQLKYFQFFLIHTPKLEEMSSFPLAKYMKIWLSLFLFACVWTFGKILWSRVLSLSCFSRCQANTSFLLCVIFHSSICWTVFPVTWLLRLFFPSSALSVDKYSLIPKITWNGTVDVSTQFMGKRKSRDVFWNFCYFVCKTLCSPGCFCMKIVRVASLIELWVADCRSLKHMGAVLLRLCSSTAPHPSSLLSPEHVLVQVGQGCPVHELCGVAESRGCEGHIACGPWAVWADLSPSSH